jgi:hypothetical protein
MEGIAALSFCFVSRSFFYKTLTIFFSCFMVHGALAQWRNDVDSFQRGLFLFLFVLIGKPRGG